jgi:ribosomal RNA assembly protein
MAGANTFIKIPKERIGALIGPEGSIKEYIEKKLSVQLSVDSETGDVTLALLPIAEDPSVLFRAKEVITAIGRGFSAERSFRLLQDEDAIFEVLDLREIAGRSLSEQQRLKGRIIGQEGKTRRIIEELTEADISIYGHTISIIANLDEMEIAREAIKMLLRGSQHSKVYRFLNRKRQELKKKKLELWEKPSEALEK